MTVLRQRIDSVEILTMNRPDQRNAVNVAMTQALARVLDELEQDDDVRVVVITGAGDRAFCSGVDLKELAAGDFDEFLRAVHTNDGFAGITQRSFPKPLIAAINGAALAGGLEIALSCDLLVASENATFGFPEVQLGLIADGGGIIRLPHWVPLPIAKELTMLGARFTAQRAYEVGLVNRVVPFAALIDAALEMAQQMAKRNAPLSLRYTKELMHRALNMNEDDAWKLNFEYMRMSAATKDFQEGPLAYVEKREPRFKGV